VTEAILYALAGAALVGIGLFGALTQAAPLRRIVAVNLLGGGVCLLLGAVGRRGGAVDPVPQAFAIAGILLAFAVTALAVALLLKLHGATGAAAQDEADLP
jgi:multicomponent Na+:H+ antiporter subunit C